MTAVTHSMASTATRSARQNQAIVHTLETLLGMNGAALEALQPLLTDLAGIGDVGLSGAALRRLAMRVFCVQRYGQHRRSKDSAGRLNVTRLAARVSREATGIDPAWQCSSRALQSWIRAWNRPAADGIASGWRGLIHPHLEEKRKHFGHSGRKPSRSPEAIAFFDGHAVDRSVQNLAALHRRTLAEARRYGWDWPASCSATRAWIARREFQKGGRKRRWPKPV